MNQGSCLSDRRGRAELKAPAADELAAVGASVRLVRRLGPMLRTSVAGPSTSKVCLGAVFGRVVVSGERE